MRYHKQLDSAISTDLKNGHAVFNQIKSSESLPPQKYPPSHVCERSVPRKSLLSRTDCRYHCLCSRLSQINGLTCCSVQSQNSRAISVPPSAFVFEALSKPSETFQNLPHGATVSIRFSPTNPGDHHRYLPKLPDLSSVTLGENPANRFVYAPKTGGNRRVLRRMQVMRAP